MRIPGGQGFVRITAHKILTIQWKCLQISNVTFFWNIAFILQKKNVLKTQRVQ